MLTEDAIVNALRRLGDTPDQVARTLTEMGIKGRQEDSMSCPLANYLRRELRVERASVFQWAIVHLPNGQGFSPNTPDPAYKFAVLFDKGEYPQLIEEEEMQ